MSNYKVALKEHLCKRSYGCGVYTVCMCSLAKDMADRIEQLEAALLYATEYAGRLAVTLAEKHYPDHQGFELLPSLLGRIDQIDNMTCGMTRALMEGKDD